MTPIYLNSSPDNFSLYPSVDQQHNEDQISNIHQFLSPTSQASSSSNSLSCHLFLNSSNDQNGFFRSELPPQEYQLEGDNFGSQTYGDHKVENNDGRGCSNSGLKFSLWKTEVDNTTNDDQNQVKWMSSKMRVMLKMKKSDSPEIKNSTTAITKAVKLEDRQDHKLPSSPDNSSNSTSSNNNTNMPIRVCSDCNTTKTPLWRSGPRGPKSLCNACGIRQRKARRAMAAAAAAAENGGNNATIDHSIVAPLKVTKTQQKDLKRQNNGHVAKYKKRQFSKQIIAAPSPSSSSSTRKNCVEEFLVSLSKNLEFHCVFPQDEKEAAILLMALSCGYVHQQPA